MRDWVSPGACAPAWQSANPAQAIAIEFTGDVCAASFAPRVPVRRSFQGISKRDMRSHCRRRSTLVVLPPGCCARATRERQRDNQCEH